MFRAYHVVVDGKSVGRLLPKEELALPLDEGMRQISVRADWWGSVPLSVDVKRGEYLSLECGSSLANWRFLFAPIYILILRNHCLWLRRKMPIQSPDPTSANSWSEVERA